MVNSHKRKNSISRLRIKGIWVEQEEDLKVSIVSTFKDLLLDLGDWRASVDGLSFSVLSA